MGKKIIAIIFFNSSIDKIVSKKTSRCWGGSKPWGDVSSRGLGEKVDLGRQGEGGYPKNQKIEKISFMDGPQLWQLVTLTPIDLQRPTVPLWTISIKRTSRILYTSYALSKWPHLHRAYITGVRIFFATAVFYWQCRTIGRRQNPDKCGWNTARLRANFVDSPTFYPRCHLLLKVWVTAPLFWYESGQFDVKGDNFLRRTQK